MSSSNLYHNRNNISFESMINLMIECKAKESLNIVNDCFNKKDIILVNLNKQLQNWIECSKTLQKNIVSLDKNINNLENKSNKRIENLDADLKINVGSLECLISDLQRSFTALEESLNQEKTRNEERFNKSQKYGEDLELRLNELQSCFEIEKSKNDEFREFIKLNLKKESSIEKESTEHMSSNEKELSIEKESIEHMSSNEKELSIEKESIEHMSSNEKESSIEKESTEHMSSNEKESIEHMSSNEKESIEHMSSNEKESIEHMSSNEKESIEHMSSNEKESMEHMSSNETESSIEKESIEHMSSIETDSYNETESSMDLTIDTLKKSNSDSEEEYFAVSCSSHEEEDIHTMPFHSDLRELNQVTKENMEPNNEQNCVDDNIFEIMKTKRGEKRKLDQELDSKKVQKIHNDEMYSKFESYLDNETNGEAIPFTGLCKKMSSTLQFSCYNDLTQYFTKSKKYVKRKDNDGKFFISVNPSYKN
jgi:hypothetical protein